MNREGKKYICFGKAYLNNLKKHFHGFIAFYSLILSLYLVQKTLMAYATTL